MVDNPLVQEEEYMLFAGQQLGAYSLVRLIGSGGMGEVYLAEDLQLHRQVAMKVIRMEVTAYVDEFTAKKRARLFRREAQAVATLDHPNILPLYAYGEDNLNGLHYTYLVMPYRPEGSLVKWLGQYSQGSLLSLQSTEHLVLQAARALQYAHDHQLIHQDVKPANFLIRYCTDQPDRPDLLLVDFGLVKFTSAATSVNQNLHGTPTYMAPEQWENHSVYASDQYALAIMAYELLTGRPPFTGGPMQMMNQHLTAQPRPPSKLNIYLSKEVDVVLLRALAKKPENRFESVAAFAHAFQQALALPASKSAPPFDNANTPKNSAFRATGTISKEKGAMESDSHLRPVSAPVSNRNHSTPKAPPLTPNLRPLTAPALDGDHLNPRTSLPTPNLRPLTAPVLNGNNPIPRTPLPISHLRPVPALAPASNVANFTPKAPPLTPNLPRHKMPIPTPTDKNTISYPPASKKRGHRRSILPIGLGILLLLLVVGSIGFFSLVLPNQQATQNAQATASAHATAVAHHLNPYPPNVGRLVLNDSLHDKSNGHTWEGVINAGTDACQFAGGAYQVTDSYIPAFNTCHTTLQSKNFAFEVRMKILKGDCGGITFRDDSTHSNYYHFEVCQDGTYSLEIYEKSSYKMLAHNTSSAITTGRNQSNLIAVVANGTTLELYVNTQRIDRISDNTYSQGDLGVEAGAYTGPTVVAYNDAKEWVF